VAELDDIHEVGLTVAESVGSRLFDDPGNIDLCKRLREAGVSTEIQKANRRAG